MKTLLPAIVLLSLAIPSVAQRDPLVSPLPRILPNHAAAFQQSVERSNQLLAQMADDEASDEAEAVSPIRGDKSPRRAFLYSAIVPGAGEFWAGSRKRAALFFGLEVIGLGMYLNWNGEGNDLEDEFRLRADGEWNPWDYLGWRGSRNSRFSSITHALPCSAYVASAPSSTSVPDAIADCPDRDVQQYYELIGKYDQFIAGWDDVLDADGNRVTAAEVDSAENFQSALRLTYEVDRNDSNKLLKRASSMLGLIMVNHVISAIDAARVARARSEGQSEASLSRRTRLALGLGGRTGRTPMLLAFRLVD
ncbi:MAG: hypothetical protein HOM68_03545 [Gemmatimonadetes bacterium]|jgi:hypothetical protein|nr:hypothetical protein [Gemmatimonadota bacterium]MBT5055595.1 hypothetical protein [Gemmatimonadota bacterium]MBT5143943.1 hypothetical protein [Gemmatimonadota bacterium]MBT5588618.1 hypothetical protein [Gemmatimonadota bacterium]MBT5962486.1 hypothetical protein [Gemmatimonadota bacterium]